MPKPHDTSASSSAQIDAGELARFLATAPDQLKGWADEQLALLGETSEPEDPNAVGVEAFADDFDEATGNLADDDQSAASPTGGARPKKQRSGTVGGVSKVNLVLVALLAAAIVIIIQQHGVTTSDEVVAPHGSMTAVPSGMSTFAQVDEEEVNQLKSQIEADPLATAPRERLAELYAGAGLFQDAADQLNEILKITPDDLDTLLAIGVAEFNLNQDAQAQEHWLRAGQVAPDNPAPWYNLGFLYMAQTPPDYAKAEEAWGKVIELDPNSELAATAQAHLERVRAASPTPSTGP